MTLYEELVRRGLIAQVTDEEEIKELINTGKATFYIGFDCTADSLTAGHFMALTLMKRLQMAGNRPIALIGGGTTMIGDPSGRTDMRKMLTKEDIAHNAECYKQRMEKGLSFLEFNYMIMQSYDFYYMFQHYGCNMQFGGDDQWSNMLGGTELIRRKLGKDAYAMTITLLTDSQGKKMGKTAGNAVWLDAAKTSPYDFFQYWRNVGDADVIKCLKMLTFIPIEEIEAMESWEGAQLNVAKEKLAFALTEMVHGTEEAQKALDASKALFVSGGNSENMPTTELSAADLDENGAVAVADLLVKTGLAPSKAEAKRLIKQGGISLDDQKVTAFDAVVNKDAFAQGHVILKKGKKVFHKVTLAD